MHITRRHALVAAVPAFGASGLAGCTSGVPDTLDIGLIGPLSGPFGLRGQDLLNGAELAAEQLNANRYRIRGRPVRVVIHGLDDKADAEVARQAAHTLLKRGVHAVLGPLLTPQTAAVIPILAAQGVPHLFTATATHLTGMGRGNTFRLQAHDDLQGRAMGMFAHENLRGQRIVSIVENGDYGHGLNRAFTAAMETVGRRVVTTLSVDTAGEVTTAMAAQVKAAQADVLMLFAREPQLRSLYQALTEVGYTGVTVVGPNVIRNRNVAALQPPVRALFATATSFDAQEFPAGRPFLRAFANRFKSEPVWGAHYAYDAVFCVADAARRAETADADAIVAKLKVIDPMTRVNQQMRFSANGELMYPAVAVYKAERGTWLAQMRSSVW